MTLDPQTTPALAERLARVQSKLTTVLTHYGRKSGKPYRVTIWFMANGDHAYLSTMNMKRQWVANVLANHKVSLRIRDELFEGELTQVTDPQEMRRVVKLMKRKYPITLPYLWLKKQPAGAFRVQLSAP